MSRWDRMDQALDGFAADPKRALWSPAPPPPPMSGSPVEVRSYQAKSLADASAIYYRDAAQAAQLGYRPIAQTWAPGSWNAGAYILAVLLIFAVGLGLLILGYLLIVKPDGTLTVTYQRP